MKTKHEKIKNPFQITLIAVIFFHIIFTLCLSGVLFHHSIRQTITTIGVFSNQLNTPDMNDSISCILSSPSYDAYQAGIDALQQAGYQNSYSQLFFYQWTFYAAFFCLLFFIFATICFSSYTFQKNSYYREVQNILEWISDTSSNSAQWNTPKHLPLSIIRSIHLLKTQIHRQNILHEEDTARIANYMENISHQLKTPLAVISAVCERLSMHHPDIEEKMSLCLLQTTKMTDLIRDFLQLGKFDCNKQAMQFEYTAATDLIETVTNNLDLMAHNKNLSFSIYGEKNIIWYCDIFWMEEIIGNILKNCIEHSENGIIQIFYEQYHTRNQIIIKDCGVGLKAGFEKIIFERYSSMDRKNTEGSGLGLSIAQQAIQLHFGTITASNHPTGGVEFRLSFPQLDPKTIYPVT